MKKIIIPIGALLITSLAHAQNLPNTENYIETRTYLEPVTTSSSTAKQIHTVQYFDGLGRPKQVVNVKASPLGRDVVNHIEYDGFGRQVKDFLPIPQSSTQNGAIFLTPLGNASAIYGGEKIYAEKILENSPLDRIQQQIQVGTDWSNKPVRFYYDTNTTNELFKFTTTTTWENGATKSDLMNLQAFPPNQLYKNTVLDEDENKTIEFKNGQGQTLLVRKMLNDTEHADTYYVYNEYNQLAFVIPPTAVYQTLTDDVLNNLCYQYRYDGRNRLVEKKVPGKGWEYMLYDKQDRLVATQDTVLKDKGQWLYTKYDQFGRVAITGIGTGYKRSVEQNTVDGFGSNNVNRVTVAPFNRQGVDVYYGSQDSSYPNSSNWVTLLSLNYYDTYPAYSFNPTFPTDIFGLTLTDDPALTGKSTKGLPVMSLVKNIEDDNWTKNYSYYDTRGRVVGTYSINHLGGFTETKSELDFAGATKQAITRHKRLATDTEKVITETFEYDHQNRLLVHKHKVDNNTEEILTQNKYNELSQLESKKVGGTSIASPLQQIDYTYNIRGWMTQINNPADLGTDLFGYKINYNTVQGLETPNLDYSDLKVKPKYNGNIAEVSWRTLTQENDPLKRYGYSYDGLNRLSAGFYQKEGNESAGEYFEKLDYDLNGNIQRLKRSEGVLAGTNTAMVIDNLKYDYSGNRLTKVTEEQIGNSNGYPYLTTHNTIPYDDNGNMKAHVDKKIASIDYNYLNLPSIITGVPGKTKKIVSSIYRADGVKLSKIISTTQDTNTTDYLDGFQYKFYSGALTPTNPMGLQFVPTSEGYFDFTNNSYIYNYTDHLGNVRLSYSDTNKDGIIQPRQYHVQECDSPWDPMNPPNCIDYWKPGEIVEVNNYYPFGLLHNYTLTTQNPYQYKYNGKELQENGMTDFGARMYMNDLGRWGVVDPKSELLESSSPYVYALNSPILYIDKDGELPILINGRVSEGDVDRASPSYWSQAIINTIKGSGIPNPGGQFHFVDGDRYAGQSFFGDWSLKKGSYIGGNTPENRIRAGSMAMTNGEFQSILSKLAKDPKTGKIIEKIQIYTHSRGAAFGQGYTERLVQLIKENANLFADPDNEVEFSYNMAPHQSGKLKAVNGVDTYTLDHNNDGLSGNDMKGAKGAFSSNERVKGFFGAHDITSFQKDLKAFTSAVSKGGANQQIINNFVQEMKKKYNITITVR